MRRMRMKIKRKIRHFKYWLVRKMFPEDDLGFLVVPGQVDVKLKQITATQVTTRSNHDFFGEELIKDMLLKDMHEAFKKSMEFEEHWYGDNCTSTGTVYIAKTEGE